MQNDVRTELGKNFIEYAVACNTDRAIPDAKSGLKPVAKRILWSAFEEGRLYSKPHVKSARIVGDVMGKYHPHGDSSIYSAMVRLSQPWVLRYPLIDWHGSNGNIAGDGPAAARYTEARLSKLAEDGILYGIKKKNVDFIDNYDETLLEPVTLPSIFPNLLCNPNTGIGVAMACNWAPHNLKEVAQAIENYLDGNEPMLPGPDFPTGGIVINKKDIPNIMRTGHGSVKIRAKHIIEGNNIVFTELPYGVSTESILAQIGELSDKEELTNINEIRDESNKKGVRIVIECENKLQFVLSQLFAKTNLQTSFSYNQVALIDKTPTELNLKDCIKIYVEHNNNCIVREAMFDIKKATDRLHIIIGLLKALSEIDKIIEMIKKSTSAVAAKETLLTWGYTEPQAKAILDMKLSRLAKLEKEDLETEKKELEAFLIKLQAICENPTVELRKRLSEIVKKYGDDRRTELVQIETPKGEEKEIVNVEPEKCVVVMSEDGLIKRIPTASFRAQRRNGKGVKTLGDITSAIIKTNTIDSLMVFTNKGKMYRILVDNLPVGTNATKGQPIKSLIDMEPFEEPTLIYSIHRDTDAKYVLFVTKNGLVKKTSLEEYIKTKKKTGIAAINIKEGDELASVSLISNEDIILLTHTGMGIKISANDISASSRTTSGVKGITLKEKDYVVSALPVRDKNDNIAIFSEKGLGKKIKMEELILQKRAGKGLIVYKTTDSSGGVSCGSLASDDDMILVVGNKSSICIKGSELPLLTRGSAGNQIIKNSGITSVSKV